MKRRFFLTAVAFALLTLNGKAIAETTAVAPTQVTLAGAKEKQVIPPQLTFNPQNYTLYSITDETGKTLKVRAFTQLAYFANPQAIERQVMNIYIPDAYFNGKAIDKYSASTAPILVITANDSLEDNVFKSVAPVVLNGQVLKEVITPTVQNKSSSEQGKEPNKVESRITAKEDKTTSTAVTNPTNKEASTIVASNSNSSSNSVSAATAGKNKETITSSNNAQAQDTDDSSKQPQVLSPVGVVGDKLEKVIVDVSAHNSTSLPPSALKTQTANLHAHTTAKRNVIVSHFNEKGELVLGNSENLTFDYEDSLGQAILRNLSSIATVTGVGVNKIGSKVIDVVNSVRGATAAPETEQQAANVANNAATAEDTTANTPTTPTSNTTTSVVSGITTTTPTNPVTTSQASPATTPSNVSQNQTTDTTAISTIKATDVPAENLCIATSSDTVTEDVTTNANCDDAFIAEQMPGIPEQGPTIQEVINAALAKGYIVVSPGLRGVDQVFPQVVNEEITGTEPSLVQLVDLSAVLNYLQANDETMPGDANKIIALANSTASLQIILLATKATIPAVQHQLSVQEAAQADATLKGVALYNPQWQLAHADAAYEWQFREQEVVQTRPLPGLVGLPRPEPLSENEKVITKQLVGEFVSYVNSLNLNYKGTTYQLNADGSGSFQDLVGSYLVKAAQEARKQWPDLTLTDYPFLTIEGNKISQASILAYAEQIGRALNPNSFDTAKRTSAYNLFFGEGKGKKQKVQGLHFSPYYLNNPQVANQFKAKTQLLKLVDPLTYLQETNYKLVKNWFIRQATYDSDVDLALSVILATKLESLNAKVDFALSWNQVDNDFYDLNSLWQWIDAIAAPSWIERTGAAVKDAFSSPRGQKEPNESQKQESNNSEPKTPVSSTLSESK